MPSLCYYFATPMSHPLSNIHKQQQQKTARKTIYNRRIAYKKFDFDYFVVKFLCYNTQKYYERKKIDKELRKIFEMSFHILDYWH